MKIISLIIASILSLGASYATSTQVENQQSQFFKAKIELDRMAYELKLKREEKLIEHSGKIDFDFFSPLESILEFGNKNSRRFNMACVEWVYKGPGSREDAIKACQGVRNMNCVEWVYKGPGSRQEAARSCRRVHSQECLEFVYKGPGSRMEAADACRRVRDMECVRFLYAGPSSRMEAARACAGDAPGNGDGC